MPLPLILILVFALASTLGAAMVFGSQVYLRDTESVYQRQRAKLDGVVRLYRTAENDRSLYLSLIHI